jgi:tRNA A37 methylthiotransferase MiaB
VSLPDKLDQVEIGARVRRITDLVEELTAQRAEDRVGTRVEVLLTEAVGPGEWLGSAAHQDPDADGTTTVSGAPADAAAGQLLAADVVASEGVDLVASAAVPALTAQR